MPRTTRFAMLFVPAIALLLISSPPLRAADEENMKSDDPTMKADAKPTRPTTRPADNRSRSGGPGTQLFQRLTDNADKLDLTDDQKQKIQKLADQTRDKIRAVISDSNGDRDKIRESATSIIRDTLQQVREILTPEQQRKFRQIMAEQKKDQDPSDRMERMSDRLERDGSITFRKSTEKTSTPPKHASTQPVDLAKIQVQRLDGQSFFLSTYKGKPLVLIFGSYTCPNFRDHAKALDDLQRRYSTRASFLLIYTKEAYPAGGWEVDRNKDAEISLPQHKDEAARIAAAKQAKSTLALTLPVAVDDMDDSVSSTFDAFPNGCIIFDRNGQIAKRQKWAEPEGIRHALDELMSKPATSVAAD